jgi:LPS sulfotransferase NodH
MSAMPPGYLICTHPRSGSTYFCQLLESTGKLGYPTEYFNRSNMLPREPDYPESLAEQAQYLIDHSATANGIHAGKVFLFTFERLVHERLLHHFEGFNLVYLDRADKLSQAISISRSLQSKAFRSDFAGDEQPAAFHFPDIKARLTRLVHADQAWLKFFTDNRLRPVRCRYEEVVADPQRAVDRIARSLRIEEPVPIDPARVSLQTQRDDRSAEWRERFVDEARRTEPELLQLCEVTSP